MLSVPKGDRLPCGCSNEIFLYTDFSANKGVFDKHSGKSLVLVMTLVRTSSLMYLVELKRARDVE
jgi:hypothetical protein